MARKKINTKEFLDKYPHDSKGRKKEWRPRGSKIPPNKVHTPKKGAYNRAKEKRKDWLNESFDE